jgi:4-amino-4-deoxychorismate lyase
LAVLTAAWFLEKYRFLQVLKRLQPVRLRCHNSSMSAPQQFLINGRSDVLLSPLDRGFAYGDGVFRTLRVQQGRPNHWDLHYKKLVEDCNVLQIVCPNAELLLADIERLFLLEEDAVAKIIISRGEGDRGYALPVLAQPARIVIKAPLPQYPEAYFNEGVQLHLCKLRLSYQAQLASIKHLNRLENVIARMEWTDNAISDGLLLDTDDRVVECTASNIFARFGKTLVTPDLSRCGVAGVTRGRILDVAPQLGLKAKVTDLPLGKLMQADEIITCNSLYGAWQVIALNHREWQPQDLAKQLRQKL